MKIEKIINSELTDELKKEWIQYNTFLDEINISVLPNNYLKDGKYLNYAEVRKLYDEWQKSRE